MQGSTISEKKKVWDIPGWFISPLFFWLALVPLSNEPNNTRYGYNIYGEKINHLLYMDDLVQKEMYKYLGMVESDGFNMENWERK